MWAIKQKLRIRRRGFRLNILAFLLDLEQYVRSSARCQKVGSLKYPMKRTFVVCLYGKMGFNPATVVFCHTNMGEISHWSG